MTFKGTREFRAGTLQALIQELIVFASKLHEKFEALDRGGPRRWKALPTVFAATGTAAYDHVLPIDYNGTLSVDLPAPDARNAGRELGILRMRTAPGTIRAAGGGLINGAASATLPTAVGLYVVYFDGVNHWTVP